MGKSIHTLIIENQSLKTENRELGILLTLAEKQGEKKTNKKTPTNNLKEKLNLLLTQMPSLVLAKQICKLIHYADPETWPRDICYDNDEPVEEFDCDFTPEPVL